MEKFKQTLKRIFFPPPVPTIVAAAFGYVFVLWVFIFEIKNPIIEYLAYMCSAYALVIAITGLPRLADFAKRTRRSVYDSQPMQRMKSTSLGGRYFSDVRFRTKMSLCVSLLINLLYIGMKLFSGIYYRSFWFISLAIYYFLLAVMRLMLVRRGKKKKESLTEEEELQRYQICGIMLLLMNQALVGIVVYMVQQNRGFNYPGLLIYLMALYAFYSVITAVINVIKFRRHGSPILSAAKVINLVAAMVSILSLTTAMLAQFGGEEAPDHDRCNGWRRLRHCDRSGGLYDLESCKVNEKTAKQSYSSITLLF